MNFTQINPENLLVTQGSCNWTNECQVEDRKRMESSSLVLLSFLDNLKNPAKCPVCGNPLPLGRYFLKHD